MDTKEMTRERISAFADGECDDAHVDIVLAALREGAGKADWEIYHQIGDVLRSDDMAVQMSSGFAASGRPYLRNTIAGTQKRSPVRCNHKDTAQGILTGRQTEWPATGLLSANISCWTV